MKYTLWFNNGRTTKPLTATSMKQAIRTARAILNAERLYKGAQYVTDEPADNGDRRMVEALDMWKRRKSANIQMDSAADCVITW